MNSIQLFPASAIVPTANRPLMMARMLESIALQDHQPIEIIIVDASDDFTTRDVSKLDFPGLKSALVYATATEKGAAAQRNSGIALSAQPFILFMDDDIILEAGCLSNLWNCMQVNPHAGGANAMITNQRYYPPGKATTVMYRMLSGKRLRSYAGMCIGPAWNLLPEDNADDPDINEVHWLNLGCTIYKREALPVPVFDSHFKGYSLMEDLAMSLTVAKKWKLYNVRSAKIFHDSQPGTHKNSQFRLAEMELVNRHYIMSTILKKNTFGDHIKLFLFELWGVATPLASVNGWKHLPGKIGGKISGTYKILFSKK